MQAYLLPISVFQFVPLSLYQPVHSPCLPFYSCLDKGKRKGFGRRRNNWGPLKEIEWNSLFLSNFFPLVTISQTWALTAGDGSYITPLPLPFLLFCFFTHHLDTSSSLNWLLKEGNLKNLKDIASWNKKSEGARRKIVRNSQRKQKKKKLKPYVAQMTGTHQISMLLHISQAHTSEWLQVTNSHQ